MTLETIADRIISDWESTWGDALGTGDLFNAIKSALQAAREEGFNEGIKKFLYEPSLYWKGYFMAIEAAAKVAEEAYDLESLAMKIRALKPQTQGESK